MKVKLQISVLCGRSPSTGDFLPSNQLFAWPYGICSPVGGQQRSPQHLRRSPRCTPFSVASALERSGQPLRPIERDSGSHFSRSLTRRPNPNDDVYNASRRTRLVLPHTRNKQGGGSRSKATGPKKTHLHPRMGQITPSSTPVSCCHPPRSSVVSHAHEAASPTARMNA